MKRVLTRSLCVLSVFLASRSSVAQEAATTYQEHVLPILQNHCLGCHNAEKKKGDLDLSTYSAAMAGGSGGDVVASGDSGGSSLFKCVSHAAEPKMPPKKPKIPDADIAVLRKWIDGGLIEAPGGKARKSKGPKVDLALKSASTGKPKGPAAMPEDLLLEPELRTTKAEALTALAASPWAPLLAVAGQHQVLLYNTDSLDLIGILPFSERRPQVLRFSRNGALLLGGGGRGARLGRVVVWDVKTGDRVFEIGEEYDQVLAADLSPDQSRIALGGPGKLIKIYSTKDGELQHSVKKHTDWVTALEFSPDGVLLATGDRSGGLHVWEAQTGRIFYTLNGHKGAITDVSWRPDSNLLASSSEDGQVILWEMGNGTKVKGWQAHPATASVKYAQDGRLVTCGRDMITRTWDGAGTKLRDFEAFTDLALHAVMTHDGGRVIAGDWTGEIRVWASADGKRVGQLTTNPPSLADRIAAAEKALPDARAAASKLAEQHAPIQAKSEKAALAVKNLEKNVTDARAAQAAADAATAEADMNLAAATQAVATAQADLQARQQEASRKADTGRQAAATVQKGQDDLRRLQEANAELLKQLEGDAGKAKELEASQKAAAEKAAEVAKLAETAQKAKADADLAANAMGPAQKVLADRLAALKQATDAKAAAQHSAARQKEILRESALALTSAQKEAADAAIQLAQARQSLDAANQNVKALEDRLALLKAGLFNVQVYAAQRELAKVQAEYDALAAKGDDARHAAAEADAKAKAGEQAAAAAKMKILELQNALMEAKAGPAKAGAACKAARGLLDEKNARIASTRTAVAQIAEAAQQAPDNATLAQAAAKAQEALALLQKDALTAQDAVAARDADLEKSKLAIVAAEKAVADAQMTADQAAKKAADLKAAAAAAASKIAPEQAQADAFKPKVDAAKARVDALRAEYLKLKPKL